MSTETGLIPATGGQLERVRVGQLDRNPAAVYLLRLGATSRRTMKGALDTMAGLMVEGTDALTFPWARLRFQHVGLLRSQLAGMYVPTTANRHLSALRSVLRSAWRLGLMDVEDYHRAADIEHIPGSRLPAGRSIASGELAALMADCANDQTSVGVRDGAIIALLYSCGLRRAELVALDVADYDLETGKLRVMGKGKKERLLFVTNGAADALADWLTVRGDALGAVFWASRRGGHLQVGQRLTTQAVYGIIQKRAAGAQLSRPITPHDFRRTCAGDLLDAGVDLVTVQRILGHADPATTARYDRRPDETKRRAAGKLHVPYVRRVFDGVVNG